MSLKISKKESLNINCNDEEIKKHILKRNREHEEEQNQRIDAHEYEDMTEDEIFRNILCHKMQTTQDKTIKIMTVVNNTVYEIKRELFLYDELNKKTVFYDDKKDKIIILNKMKL